jgi:hypothetical protein
VPEPEGDPARGFVGEAGHGTPVDAGTIEIAGRDRSQARRREGPRFTGWLSIAARAGGRPGDPGPVCRSTIPRRASPTSRAGARSPTRLRAALLGGDFNGATCSVPHLGRRTTLVVATPP